LPRWIAPTSTPIKRDAVTRPRNPAFVLNQERYQGASILLARRNFGCGSSREHAPWAIREFGFRALIAPSFADIFNNNCLKNGVLPIVLSEEEVETLFAASLAQAGCRLAIDLETQTVTTPAARTLRFEVDPFRRQCLLNGWDDIALTLRHADKIRAFEANRLEQMPWLAGGPR